MSNLQELKNTAENPLLNKIKEIKNSGVEYKKLGEIVEIKHGKDYKHLSKGNIPVYGTGGIIDYVDEYVYNKITVLLPRKGSIQNVFYVDTPFWNTDTIYYTEINESLIIPRFLYYVICNEHIEKLNTSPTARPALTKKILSDIEIPLPPLEVQAEIVRILDTFTELIKELIKEHELRKKQYSYYRDKLLTFGEDTQRVKLGEICSFKCGGDVPKGNFSKEKTDKYTIPIYSNGIGKNALYGYTDKAIITQKCVTISSRGTIGYSALREEAFYPIVRLICCFPNENLLPEFLVYAIQTINFVIPKGGIPQLTIPMLKEYKIPLPPIDTQKRIVDILDNFERYTNDLQEGLPAEIEKRKKQYAYYRDELLRFERK